MTAAQKLTEKVREEALAQGKAEIVLRLMLVKFGPLSEEVSQRVQHATPAEIDT